MSTREVVLDVPHTLEPPDSIKHARKVFGEQRPAESDLTGMCRD
jgi:hypothetical protein